MSYTKLLSEAATLLPELLRKYRARKERVGSTAELGARELREYGLRCCPPGSMRDRRVYDLGFWGV
jgi:hypothetical protein